jgi:hypothetical protein
MPTSEYTLYKTASGVNDSDYQLVITQQQYKLKTLEFLQFGKPCKHLLIFRDRFFHRDDSLEQLCSKEKLKPTSILIIGHLKEQSFLKLFIGIILEYIKLHSIPSSFVDILKFSPDKYNNINDFMMPIDQDNIDLNNFTDYVMKDPFSKVRRFDPTTVFENTKNMVTCEYLHYNYCAMRYNENKRYMSSLIYSNLLTDQSPKYIYPILKYINLKCDCKHFAKDIPIVPLMLLDMHTRITSGAISSSPSFNLLDIIEYLKAKIYNQMAPTSITPWVHGFNGSITFTKSNYIFDGDYHINGNTIVILNTLKKIDNVEQKLQDLKETRKIIDWYYKNTIGKLPIIVKYSQLIPNVLKNIKSDCGLVTKIRFNPTLFNSSDIMTKYKTINDLLDDFYISRLELYKKRLKIMELDSSELEAKKHGYMN